MKDRFNPAEIASEKIRLQAEEIEKLKKQYWFHHRAIACLTMLHIFYLIQFLIRVIVEHF